MTEKIDKPANDIARQAGRMKSNRDSPGPSPLRGIGTFGMIGWSIVVPTVGGAFLGLWLDRITPQKFSWTLALILAGVVVGGFIAAAWMNKEGSDK
ncbi:AtpZ/AtpI family protein [Pacificibacter marinus]|uniref:Putative F0F1-ATPase subunit (ATPase_gene1) n=1 Tax=Pacificibacter marinus TaxID=658057 RepID=A0A1Y5SY61_9RHOB|nr:AtpZ/AtpI family protein [Pacificibacter marinus]SEK84578.1 ATP synthase protein I [Pacificibacter marinus]SLN49197.1 Putative F0F1-ATPase subunit (ATPase_gene1) [Pacificibacter marinus]